jgi:hypothetical protein
MATVLRETALNECRRCSTFCDRVIAPSTCVADNCPYLYAYDDPISGRRFMGCVQRVFASEIDVELFREAERTKAGFGTVRLAAAPLERCRFTVEQAYDGRGLEAYRCVNKAFFDWPETLDLRDRCHR